ncbi:PIR protein [Plasmodium vivax]|nr:PIR protein [Plasmodium vivax]
MQETEVDKLVISFFVQRIFGKIVPYLSETVPLDKIFREANITEITQKQYSDAFNVLLHHINNDGVFLYGNDLEACKYINYILYKEIEYTIKQSYDDTLNSFFKQILEAYSRMHGGNNRCTSNIYNMHSDTYHKINVLYQLYDKNVKCSSYVNNTLEYGCDDFVDFLNLYDDIPVKKPKIHDQEQMRQTVLQSVHSVPRYTTNEISYIEPTQLPEDKPISQTIQENQVTHEGNSAYDDHGSNDILPVILQKETTYPPKREDEGRIQRLLRSEPPFRHLYSSGTSSYPRQHGHEQEKDFSNEVETSPQSVMSTITGVFQSVEPAPILGVSGKMGALFLLFKYTPVGTFFGGRRRRNHLIPSGFPGAYPGFPGYEEHYDGNFGPGPINISYQAE